MLSSPVSMTVRPWVYKPVTTPAKASLEVAPVKDSRAVPDGSILVYEHHTERKSVQSVQHAFVLEEPFAEIFQNALNLTLQRNGFTATNGARYVLESEIANIGYETWDLDRDPFGPVDSVGEIISTISVHFELKDKTTGQSMWQQTYNAEDVSTSQMGKLSHFISKGCSRATEDIVRQLIVDPEFRDFFEIQSTNAP
jgi:hypothetical protein